jgi:hypothetical protein
LHCHPGRWRSLRCCCARRPPPVRKNFIVVCGEPGVLAHRVRDQRVAELEQQYGSLFGERPTKKSWSVDFSRPMPRRDRRLAMGLSSGGSGNSVGSAWREPSLVLPILVNSGSFRHLEDATAISASTGNFKRGAMAIRHAPNLLNTLGLTQLGQTRHTISLSDCTNENSR